MADASDSKSDEGFLVWVQVPPSALLTKKECHGHSFFVALFQRRDLNRILQSEYRLRSFFVALFLRLDLNKQQKNTPARVPMALFFVALFQRLDLN